MPTNEKIILYYISSPLKGPQINKWCFILPIEPEFVFPQSNESLLYLMCIFLQVICSNY